MAGLAAVGTLAYGGPLYTFDGASTVKVHTAFVQDDAKRTVIGHEITIDVTATITAAASAATDATLLAIRAALSKQGAELKFINRGFGTDIWINRPGGGGLRDMRWGPVPEILEWESIGSSQACEIVWRVKTFIPVCDTYGQHITTGVMAYNYEANFQINKGFTTRVVTGYLEIAQTRIGRTVPDCADLYRGLIEVEPPLGFHRVAEYGVDASKSRATFTITDKEIESKNPWPSGVVNITAHHRANWMRGGQGAAKIRNTISAEIELAKGAAPTQGWLIFGGILSQRVITAAAASGKVPFLQDLTVEEDIYGFSSSFQASYWILGNPSDFLQKSGLWKPITGANWTAWRNSLAGTMFNERGSAGLVLSPGSDAIVDICGAQPMDVSSVVNGSGQGNVPGQSVFKNRRPPQNQSYIKYKMQVVTSGQGRTVTQKTMQSPEQSTGSTSMMDNSGPDFGNQQGTADIVQQSGRKSYQIALIGYAERAGYLIPKPLLQTVGGLPAVESSAVFIQEAVGMFFGVPVFRAAWQIIYDISSSPGITPSPANPEQGIPPL